MPTLLPHDFRCLRHVQRFLARNLPRVRVTGAELSHNGDASVTIGAYSDLTVADNLQECPGDVSGGAMSATAASARSGDSRFPSGTVGNQQRCVSSYFIISLPDSAGSTRKGAAVRAAPHADSRRGGLVVHCSEVAVGTQHPEWQALPENVVATYADLTRFVFSLFVCRGDATSANPAHDTLIYEMLVDLTHVRYVSANVTELAQLSRLPFHVDSGQHALVILLRCNDGVFFPLHQGIEILDELGTSGPQSLVAAGLGFAPGTMAPLATDFSPTSRPRNSSQFVMVGAPSESGEVMTMEAPDYLLRGNSAPHSLAQSAMAHYSGLEEKPTVGDIKALTIASLAWENFQQITSSKCETQRNAVDQRVAESRHLAEVAAQRVALEVRLSKAATRLFTQQKEIEQLESLASEERSRIELGERELTEVTTTLDLLRAKQRRYDQDAVEMTSATNCVLQRVQEERQKLARELRYLFPVETTTSTNGTAPPLRLGRRNTAVVERAETTTICGCGIPALSDDIINAGGEAVQKYGAGAGHAAHLISTLSALYGCILPHPLLVAGGRSRVMEKPGVGAASGGSLEQALPLFSQRSSDRALMKAAFDLLNEDAQALLAAVPVGEQQVWSRSGEANALGHILHRTLASVCPSPSSPLS